jgi:S-adenosylmethionine:tRNA ribosyltransferase-isomerase
VIARAGELVQAPEPSSCEAALMVARRRDATLTDACFTELGRFVHAGDLLVVNTSATLAAAVSAELGGEKVELHLSTPADDVAAGGRMRGPDANWVVEVRTTERGPFGAAPVGAIAALPGGASAELLAPYLGSSRLSIARLRLGEPVEDYLRRHGHPIRYPHSPERPIQDYQTVFARDPGSAEMPSAARPFTGDLVAELIARGVLLAPITLHCGVSSLEAGEHPYPERYRVPAQTASLVNAVRWQGGRVIAVGTTVVRALETVASAEGFVTAGSGLTSLVVTPDRALRAVDGLITGWHEPGSSHLSLLEAVSGSDLLRRSYAAARAGGHRFHEFGDSHLILP